MRDRIFLIDSNDKFIPLENTEYEEEIILQELIARFPDVLSGDDSQLTGRNWVLIGQEIGVPNAQGGGNRMSLDHLYVDAEGIPTFVEVKRSSDTRIRREVVAQMLDYAANGTAFLNIDSLRDIFVRTHEAAGRDPDTVFSQAFAEDLDMEVFWRTIESNLRSHRIRLVFVADSIPLELRSILEFLNAQMRTIDVFAIEVKQYTQPGSETRVLVPRVIGWTAESIRSKGVSPSLDEKFSDSDPIVQQADSLLQEWATSRGYAFRNSSSARTIHRGGIPIVHLYPAFAKIEFNLDTLDKFGLKGVEELFEELQALSGIPLTRLFPGVPVGAAVEHWDRFTNALDEYAPMRLKVGQQSAGNDLRSKSGKLIIAEMLKGNATFHTIGREGGLAQAKLDLADGSWEKRPYRVSESPEPQNNKWFTTEEFFSVWKELHETP